MAHRAQITVRPFNTGDEHVMLTLWRASMPSDGIDSDILSIKVLADPNFDPEGCLIARVEDQAVGFALALGRKMVLGPEGDLEPDSGWITVFGVAPRFRRRGVASELFDRAEGFLREHGHRHIEVSTYAPNYFWPGVDSDRYPDAQKFLQARGYRRLYSAVSMDKNLVGFSIPPEVLEVKRQREAEGYRFTYLSPRYLRPLIEFNQRVFYPDWTRAIRESILRRVPWDRTWLALAPDDTLCGFAQFGAYDYVPDRFGPFGVDDTRRGTGLGKVLLNLTLEDMATRGFHNAWFLWTGEKTPAGYLYQRTGFQVTRRFEIFARDL